MNLKTLGTTFGLGYLIQRASGASQREAFRRAGTGSLTEQTLPEDHALLVSDLVEMAAVQRQREQYLDRPVELTQAAQHRPMREDYNQAEVGVARIQEMPDEELYAFDRELAEHEAGIVAARKFMRELRRQNRDRR